MARPRKDPAARKTAHVQVFAEPERVERWRRAALEDGYDSLSAWVRRSLDRAADQVAAGVGNGNGGNGGKETT